MPQTTKGITFSRHAISEYLPVIRAIYASFEVSAARYKDQDKRECLRTIYLEKEFGTSKLYHAMDLLGGWLEGSKFRVENFNFCKNDKKAKWSEMLAIIHDKLVEYGNDRAAITIAFDSSGRVTREILNHELSHDFEDDGLKAAIVGLLCDENGYVKTEDIRDCIGSRSTASVSKIIAEINRIIRLKLQLPANKKFIESKKYSGYRINPLYNVVRVR